MRYLLFFLILCNITMIPQNNNNLKERIEEKFSAEEGDFALAFEDLTTGEQILINEKESFHAASTMKTPVMMEVFKQAHDGKFSLNDSVVVNNEFKSIVDSSLYSMNINEDSGEGLYQFIGQKRTIYQLLFDMVTLSSNLATNILIDITGAENVMKTLNQYGIKDIKVLRGVEDIRAFRAGLNNTVTAYDLMLTYKLLANREFITPEISDSIADVLLKQKHKDRIPAKLPNDVKVAHKTGWITGVGHDSGFIILPDGRKYVLVLLSKNVKNDAKVKEMHADISLMIYEQLINKQ
jgi:beta-lactamase class A